MKFKFTQSVSFTSNDPGFGRREAMIFISREVKAATAVMAVHSCPRTVGVHHLETHRRKISTLPYRRSPAAAVVAYITRNVSFLRL